jgi:hypothetical protein
MDPEIVFTHLEEGIGLALDLKGRQMLADVLARPLIQGTDENASEGAGVSPAMIGGIGAGVFKDYEDARKFAPVFTAVTEPNRSSPPSTNPITGGSLTPTRGCGAGFDMAQDMAQIGLRLAKWSEARANLF